MKPTYEALAQRVRELTASEDKLRQLEKDRQLLKEDYQTLFREMLNGFSVHEIICDNLGKPVDYRFLNVNPSFERMTGLNAQDIKGKTVLEVLPGTELSWIETFGKVALTGEPAFFENYSNDMEKHFQVTAFRPKANQFACIFSDISDFKRSERELAQVNTDLKAKNEELEQIVYVASHDLRSPLVNIEGYGRELEYGIQDLRKAFLGKSSKNTLAAVDHIIEDDISEALRFIRTSTQKMDMLLSGLLRLSRSGRAALKIEPLDMNKLISKVVASTEFQIKKTGAKVLFEDLPPCQGDAIQVDQVFSNLLENALKYKDHRRPGIIQITGKLVGEQPVYCIEDNGIGIDFNHLNKIFEIFHQLDPVQHKGEGLGLTIVKRILSRLGGSVRVESELGAGSCFYISMPNAT